MEIYEVIFYTSYLVEAENKDEALEQAEKIFDQDFMGECFGLSEIFDSEVKESVVKSKK